MINLYGENFNPVLDSAELSLQMQGRTNDPKARHYGEMLLESEEVIMIFPIWWGTMPAMLKGFIDKVFLKGVVYDTTPEGALMPCLSINRTTIVTSSEEDSEVLGNFIEGYFAPLTLATVGMNNVKWFNLDHISSRTDAQRDEFIAQVNSYIAG